MKHTDIKQLISTPKKFFNTNVTVCGWIRSFRDSKNMAFITLNDGTSLAHLQIVIDKNVIPTLAEGATRVGSSVKVVGVAVESFNKNQAVEINAQSVELLGDCPLDYPIQKAKTSLEYLRTLPHLRVRTNTFNAVFRIRSKISAAIHDYFQERDYLYVHTPIITGSDCEGAGKIFQVTTLGYAPKYKSEEEYYAHDFFGQSAGLTVSGQLEGEVMALAFGKIYTFGPTFRAENSNTTRHAAEFWQIEPEVAFAEIDDIIEIAAEFIKYIIKAVLESCPDELALLERFYEPGLRQKLQKVVDDEFVKVEYTEAIEILKKSGKQFVYPVEWGCDLQTEHERYLTDIVYNKPVFVVNYPKDLKSFYMKQNPDGKTVAATDLLVPGVGEIIGCSEREADYDKLMQAINDRGMKVSDYENYMDLRKFGSVPHSGFGLGLERILMYVTGMGNIRDTQIFPRAKGELK
ncbi:MAG: asparagine--tRNA ligase [Clostridia bacterium]|nr:asparagine--tRNA ligase [Clostridia bacterium]MDE7328279.1 asparagine--tRNA ligase [Clostridia bacterium]